MKYRSIAQGLATGMFVGTLAFGTTSCSKVGDLIDSVSSFFSSDDKSRDEDYDDAERGVDDDSYDVEVDEEPDADFNMEDFRHEAAAINAAAQTAAAAVDEAKDRKDVASDAKPEATPKSKEVTEEKSPENVRPVADAKPAEKPKDESPVSVAMVEQQPVFPGGNSAMYKWISTNLRYPPSAAEEGVTGKVIVQFVVEKDGSISDVKVIRGKHPDLDAEAKRVVSKMPKWQPGRNNGQPVRVAYTLPINFKLQ